MSKMIFRYLNNFKFFKYWKYCYHFVYEVTIVLLFLLLLHENRYKIYHVLGFIEHRFNC